jgi:Cof subfamily protein (haloacid dehalogenase superfamily)
MAAAAPDILQLFGGQIKRTPGVYQQGLMVYGASGDLIYERWLTDDIIEAVENFCDLNDLALIAYAGEEIYCRQQCKQTNKIAVLSEPHPTVFSEGLANLQRSGVTIHKLIILEDDHILKKIRPSVEVAVHELATLTKAVPGMLEVLPLGSSKGEGVKILLESIGVSPEHVIAFGDGENDIEMLTMVKLGVAMDNARTSLKNIADAFALSNDEEGVAKALSVLVQINSEKYFLK